MGQYLTCPVPTCPIFVDLSYAVHRGDCIKAETKTKNHGAIFPQKIRLVKAGQGTHGGRNTDKIHDQSLHTSWQVIGFCNFVFAVGQLQPSGLLRFCDSEIVMFSIEIAVQCRTNK